MNIVKTLSSRDTFVKTLKVRMRTLLSGLGNLIYLVSLKIVSLVKCGSTCKCHD